MRGHKGLLFVSLLCPSRHPVVCRTCEKFGEVVDVFMPRGQDGGTRGFGFVTFSSKAEAEDASRDLDGSDVDGRRVKANIARARPPRPGDRGRGPDRGSSRGGGRSTTKLYVGNLPMDTTEEDLAKTFDKFGKISLLELKRVRERMSGIYSPSLRALLV